jgi:hypothetical protein
MGFKLAGIMFLAMLAMAGLGYWYYNDSQARMAILQENNAKLNTAVQISEQAVASLQADILRANEQLKQVNQEFAAIRAQNNVLADKLAKHDLAVLGSGKPGLVEKLVNRGTVNAGRCFELLSGATLTDKEKEAKDGKSFNNECPWLWPGPSTP